MVYYLFTGIKLVWNKWFFNAGLYNITIKDKNYACKIYLNVEINVLGLFDHDQTKKGRHSDCNIVLEVV
jgi:hypothetical protein